MKNKLFLLLIILLAVIIVPVNAKEENFYANESVVLEEDVDATTFVAGNAIDIKSNNNGLNFAAGNIVNISGAHDYVFAAGNNITITNLTTKDMFLAGNVVTINSSEIRDLYVAASSITINSKIERNAYLGGDRVTINSEVNGDITVASDNIVIGEEAIINGTLKYPEGVKPVISNNASINKTKTYESDDYNKELSVVDTIIIPTIISYVSLLLIAFILLTVSKKAFAKYEKTGKKATDILITTGIGFIGLIVVPVVAIILMLTLIGIPLSIITLIIYGIMIYLSAIPATYYLGSLITKGKMNSYLLLTLSLLVFYIVRLIPIIGTIIVFLIICLGLGIFIKNIKDTIKLK